MLPDELPATFTDVDGLLPAGVLLIAVEVPRAGADTFVAVVLFATVLPADIPLVVLRLVVVLETASVLRPVVVLRLEPPLSEDPLPAKTLFEPV